MKPKVVGFTVLFAIALVAALFVGKSMLNTQSAKTSRFAPLAANGISGASVNAIDSGSQGNQMEIASSIKNDVSEPLSSIVPLEGETNAQDADMNELFVMQGRGAALNQNAPAQLDGALQTEQISPNAPKPIVNFDGVTNVNGVLPPDTNGDVGPNHYMQWVNLSFAIYSKTGALLYGPAAGNTLWSGFGGVCQTSNHGDPIVLYDQLADRWMVSQFAVPGGASGYHQCIAVSQTGDPTGVWYRYDFLYSATNMNDYPHFGVWPDGYYMTVHEFKNAASWAGQGVAVFERDKMLLGQPARMVKFNLYSTDPNMGGMLPTDLDGPAPAAGTPNYFVEPDDDAGGFAQDQLQVWAFHVDWANVANSTFTPSTTLSTAAFDSNMCGGSRSCIPQKDTTAKLDAIADRAMYRAQFREFTGYQTIVMNHTVDATGNNRAGIRWYELRNTGGAGWVINQQSTFSPDATNRWMGSIAMNSSGDIALGYSASSSTMFPAIRFTGRLSTDPLNALTQGEGTLIAGSGSQTHSAARWGDYSMLTVDPTDDCTFWYTSEYLKTTGSAPWVTRIGSFKLSNCGVQPLNTGFLAPSANIAVKTAAGDNNGYQTSPGKAYVEDGGFASDSNSGTNTSTDCKNIGKDKHLFYNFNFNLPVSASIEGIEVELKAKVNSSANAPKICIQLSWDGGKTWTTAKSTPTLTTGIASYKLGASANTWGHTWAQSNFANNSFRVRVINIASSIARTFYLDSIAVNVTYQP